MLKDFYLEMNKDDFTLSDELDGSISGRLNYFSIKYGFEILIGPSNDNSVMAGTIIFFFFLNCDRDTLQNASMALDINKEHFLNHISQINRHNQVYLSDELIDNDLDINFLFDINWFESGIIKIKSDISYNTGDPNFLLFIKDILLHLNKSIKCLFGLEDDILPLGFPEGSKKIIEVNRYERNPGNRKICIENKGTDCLICNFSFTSTYPVIGSGFIHVHHLVPVSQMSENYIVNPLEDLIPVCPNCHAMLHKKDPPYTPDELREIISSSG